MILVLAACSGGGSGGGQQDAPTGDDAPTILDGQFDGPIPGDGGITGIGGPPAGMCSDGWCWVQPLPQGVSYAAAWGASASDVWAVTDLGTMLHFDGTAWTRYGNENEFGGIAAHPTMVGRGANDIWLAHGGLFHWNGTAWTQQIAQAWPLGFVGTSVWTGGGTDEWTGTQWLSHPAPNGTTIAIGGSGATVLAVSSTGTLSQFSSGLWGVLDATSHPGNAAAVIDATHLVVAQDGNVAFWTSGTWTQHQPPVSASWDQVVARSPSDVWISGGGRYRYHWDGNQWTAANDLLAQGVVTLSTVGTDLITVAAQVRRLSGTTWSNLLDGYIRGTSVSGTGPDDLWFLSNDGLRLQHWNGTAWAEIDFGYQAKDYVQQLWASGPNDVWIVAGHSASFSVVQRILYHWNGIAWSRTANGAMGQEDGVVSLGFTDIWGTAPDNLYAITPFVVFHKDASGWTEIPALGNTTSDNHAVFGSSANDVYVLTTSKLWHWDGAQWTSKTTPNNFFAGIALAPNDVWLGAGTAPTHYDGTLFVPVTPTTTMPTGTITQTFQWGASTFEIWNGSLATVRITRPTFFGMSDWWRAPDGHMWVTANNAGNTAAAGLLVH